MSAFILHTDLHGVTLTPGKMYSAAPSNAHAWAFKVSVKTEPKSNRQYVDEGRDSAVTVMRLQGGDPALYVGSYDQFSAGPYDASPNWRHVVLIEESLWSVGRQSLVDDDLTGIIHLPKSKKLEGKKI